MSGFEINGEAYEVPRLDSLNLNEEQVLYDVAGIVQSDFAPAHPEASEEQKLVAARVLDERLRNPAFKRALVYIAYRRKNPGVAISEMDVVVGETVNAIDSEVALWRGDADPTTTGSPSESESEPSSNEPLSSSDSSSNSQSIAEQVVVPLASTGTTR